MTVIAWPEIESFHQVRKSVVKYPHILGGTNTVRYQAKVKLHGTNTGILCKNGKFTAQSRTVVITSGNDNAGFAAWLESETVQKGLAIAYGKMPSDMIVYGEWFGQGVQKGVAASQVLKRSFAVFAARMLDDGAVPTDALLTEPGQFSRWFAGVPDVYVLPWVEGYMDIPWLEEASVLEPLVASINENVKFIETEDPWIAKVFGIKGTGEGLVYYPVSHGGLESFANLAFKAKGEKHKVVTKSQPAQIDASVATSIDDFAALVLAEARLEQGAMHVSGGELKYEMRLIGQFMAWIAGDVQKECCGELDASKLTWKQVQKAVCDRARIWYVGRTKVI